MPNFPRLLRALALVAIQLATLCQTTTAQIPKLQDVPDTLSVNPRYSDLTNAYAMLVTRKNSLVSAVRKHNAKCGNVKPGTDLDRECAGEWAKLEEERKSYSAAVEQFNQSLRLALATSKYLEPKTGALADRLSALLMDPSVVDARDVPSGLPKSLEEAIPNTAAGARVRKGFQAAMLQDWQVALAWFQDALNHEPGNPELQKLVDLAQSALNKARETAPVMPKEMLHALALRDSEQARKTTERDALMRRKLAEWKANPSKPVSEDLLMWLLAQSRPQTSVAADGLLTDAEIMRILAQPRPNAAAVELEQIRKSLAAATEEIETDKARKTATARHESLTQMGKVLAELQAAGKWKAGDALLDEGRLDPAVQRTLSDARERIQRQEDAAVQAIEEQTFKKLLEAGHQILTLGNTDWTPSRSAKE